MLCKKIKPQALIYINGSPVRNIGTQSIRLGFSEQTDFSPPPQDEPSGRTMEDER